jgi:hypothetical protein
MAGPPEKPEKLKDLNTGRASRETYAALIDPTKNEQLLPIPMYIDGAAVSHFHDMEIIQVRISLGFWSRKTRLKEYAWGVLGYVEKVHEQGGVGRKMYKESHHAEVQDASDSEDHSTDAEEMEGVGDHNEQDFHSMLSCILASFVELQNRGYIFDVFWEDRLFADTHWKPFVPFVRCDNKEGDHFGGKFQVRHGLVKQICRYCHVPMAKTDYHLANYPRKTVSEIRKLVERADFGGLQAISQHYLRNAFYDVRFSLGNDWGIHGACPVEILHSLYLGIFKYIRDIFFAELGKDSLSAKAINGLAKVYCKLFQRQSDRSIPPTHFSKGIKEGKLMAKEYRGVLLIMLVLVRSTKGSQILTRSRKGRFKANTKKDNWILLLETLLEWDAYLNE